MTFMAKENSEVDKVVGTAGSHIGKRAIVIGAGISGLAAARALSDFFADVIIFERDELREHATPRSGVPQGRHPHGLLAGAMVALEDLFPGFTQDLARAGAVQLDPGSDVWLEFPGLEPFPRYNFGWKTFSMTRPLIELAMLQRLRRQANVTLREQCTVLGLIGSADGSAVTGVSYLTSDGKTEALSADIVVDASAHGAVTMNFLRSNGRTLPEVSTVGADIRYSSAVFSSRRYDIDFKMIVTYPKAPERVRGGYLMPAENGRWQVLLVGRGDVIPPVDGDAFLEYAQQLETPSIYNEIRDAERLGNIVRFSIPESTWRHFGQLSDFPHRLLPIGDAICRFNPVFGQGMAVAVKEANMLRHLLQTEPIGTDSLATLGQTFLAEAEALIADPWAMSAAPDFIYPETRGQRPPDLEERLKFGRTLEHIAVDDPDMYKLIAEVRHLLKPLSVLDSPEIVQRVEESKMVKA
jgi:2-polyprenyl-6-methoxyphenol hydroxylase-like FAD-dependent oxidoreductase